MDDQGSDTPWSQRALAGFRPFLILTVFTVGLAVLTTHSMLERCDGEPCVALDDSFIHFQYARTFAELRPFEYTPGGERTPGATSILWPAVLAPFWAVGFRDTNIIWIAWALGWLAFAGLAYECYRLSEGLVRREVALGAGAMSACFGANLWFAGSGMEVIELAWLLARSARRSAEWFERDEGDPLRPSVREMLLLAAAAPLLRPEGALASVGIAVVLFMKAPQGRRRLAGVAMSSVFLPMIVGGLATGHFLQSTAAAKWLPLNAYYHRPGALTSAVGHQTLAFLTQMLNGKDPMGDWLPGIPRGGRLIAWLALPALIVQGRRALRLPRAMLALGVGAAIFVTTSYEACFASHQRFMMPFVAGWLVGLAALCELVGVALERYARAPAITGPLLAAALAGRFAGGLSNEIDDVASCGRAIREQQVWMARWARENVPPGAVIGLNDAGAIAYLSDHTVFDFVGLTTGSEVPYWVAGPSSRFEHYEHLGASKLPSYLLVYRSWFGIPDLLGEKLTERTVHHGVLGDFTKAAHRANWEPLGSGELPVQFVASTPPVDTLDVADLESEAAHGYALLDATFGTNRLARIPGHIDGGRSSRSEDRFRIDLAPGGSLVARWALSTSCRVHVHAGERELPAIELDPSAWREVAIPVPAELPGGPSVVRITADDPCKFHSLHYWSYPPGVMREGAPATQAPPMSGGAGDLPTAMVERLSRETGGVAWISYADNDAGAKELASSLAKSFQQASWQVLGFKAADFPIRPGLFLFIAEDSTPRTEAVAQALDRGGFQFTSGQQYRAYSEERSRTAPGWKGVHFDPQQEFILLVGRTAQ